MSQPNCQKIVIVGAGHGGCSVAAYLRQYGFDGKIDLIGAESVPPYQRPPLSKAWMKGETTIEALALKPVAFYETEKIQLHLGMLVNQIDVNNFSVRLANGATISYDRLILATGSEARSLPMDGTQFENVLSLRTLHDADRLRAVLLPGKKLVIIGGGYVGLECAATARALGVDVVLIERSNRILERVASKDISDFLQKFHEDRGVVIKTGAELLSIKGEHSAESVALKDGQTFLCDAVLVGVGANPTTALAVETGLTCNDGVTVDADCRTSNPHIFAIGDVAKRPHDLYGCALRLESVPSVLEQAKRVASVLSGRVPAAAEVPWFWSDQFELKLQMTGLLAGATNSLVRGDPAQSKFAVYHLYGGCVIAVEAVNSPQDFLAGKKLIAMKKVVDIASLSNPQIPLANLLN